MKIGNIYKICTEPYSLNYNVRNVYPARYRDTRIHCLPRCRARLQLYMLI